MGVNSSKLEELEMGGGLPPHSQRAASRSNSPVHPEYEGIILTPTRDSRRTSNAGAALPAQAAKLEDWLDYPAEGSKERATWLNEHLLKPEHDEREVFPRASAWRTLTALVGSPFGARVPFHVTNLGTELQAEKSTDSWTRVGGENWLRELPKHGNVHSGSRVRFGTEEGGWKEKTATELLEKAIESTKLLVAGDENKVVHPGAIVVKVNATTNDWGDPYVGMKKQLQKKKIGSTGRPEDWEHLCDEGRSEEVESNTLLRFGYQSEGDVATAPGYWTKERYAAPYVQLTESIIRHGFELSPSDPFGKGPDPRVLEHRENHSDEVDMARADVMYKPFLQFALDMLTDFFMGGGKWSKVQFKQYVLVLKAAMLDNPGQPLLLSKVRGPAGESIYLWAVLMEQFDLAEWLLQLEPMLFKTRYWGPEYRGENALHILCSKKKLKELRGLAETVLFYKPPDYPDSLPQRNLWSLADNVMQLVSPSLPSACFPLTPVAPGAAVMQSGGASPRAEAPPTSAQTFSTLSKFKEQLGLQRSAPSGDCNEALLDNSTSLMCLLSWKLMFHHWEPIDDQGRGEKNGIAGDPTMSSETSKALCGDWMRAAWTRHVNGLAYGSFFEPAELGGTCYYGGTPAAIATVMGDVDAVRFLCMEVGCTDAASWKACRPPTVGAAGYKHLYPDSLDPEFTKDGDPKSHRYASSLLKSWDHRRCARLDCADRFGNTAAHMAVSAHPTADMYVYLQSLYRDGYGRCALYYYMEELKMAEAARKEKPEMAEAARKAAADTSKLCLVVTPLSEDSALSGGGDDQELTQAVQTAVQNMLDRDGPLSVEGTDSPLAASPVSEVVRTGSLHGETRLRIPLVLVTPLPPATDEIVTTLAERLERHFFPNAGADAHTSLSPPKLITATFSKGGVATSETLHIGLALNGHATVAAAVRCALAGSCGINCTQKVNSCTSVLCPLHEKRQKEWLAADGATAEGLPLPPPRKPWNSATASRW